MSPLRKNFTKQASIAALIGIAIGFAAQHLQGWVPEVLAQWLVSASCKLLLPNSIPYLGLSMLGLSGLASISLALRAEPILSGRLYMSAGKQLANAGFGFSGAVFGLALAIALERGAGEAAIGFVLAAIAIVFFGGIVAVSIIVLEFPAIVSSSPFAERHRTAISVSFGVIVFVVACVGLLAEWAANPSIERTASSCA